MGEHGDRDLQGESCSYLSTLPHTAKQTWELHQLSVTLKEGTMANIHDTKARHIGTCDLRPSETKVGR